MLWKRPDGSSGDGEDNGAFAFLKRWAPVLLVAVIIVGTIWYSVRTEPEFVGTAHKFQSKRRVTEWESVSEILSDDYYRAGGTSADVHRWLAPGGSYPEHYIPAASARVSNGRIGDGLAVVETDQEEQLLCLRQDEQGSWRVMPSPFLLYYLQKGDILAEPGTSVSDRADVMIIPVSPPPGVGQAHVLLNAVWIRETSEHSFRALIGIKVEGLRLQLSMRSPLMDTKWSDSAGNERSADRMLWTNIMPDADGNWPLGEGTWWMEFEWDEVPDGSFSLSIGPLVSGDERRLGRVLQLNLDE